MADPGTATARVAIVTLGCGRNEVDSDQLAGLLQRDGIDVVDDAEEADVVLVNTCTFIAPAKQESVDTVLAACDLKESGARGVVVVGCMAERYSDELAEAIPEADAVIGFGGYPQLPRLVQDILAGRPHERVVGKASEPTVDRRRSLPVLAASAPSATTHEPAPWVLPVPEAPPEADPASRPAPPGQDDLDRIPATGPRFPTRRLLGERRPWSYLKIASGCDRLCTFCAIPSFRGRFRSRPVDELVAEARWLAEQGIRELVLVSENTTSWGKDLSGHDGQPGGRSLQPYLLRSLAAVDGIERLRLMYLQPAELQLPLLEAMVEVPEVAAYFDLSLQHVSESVLTRMARAGSPQRLGALIERIRELAPDAVFRSNFILGFPGETERDVEELATFLGEHRLDWVGLFTYSPEDGTPSVQFDDQVPEDEARARLEHVASIQEHAADAAARRFVGRDLTVLVDVQRADDSGVEVVGRSYREAPDTDGEVRLVTADAGAPDLPVGRMVTATVVAAEGVDLVAQVHGT